MADREYFVKKMKDLRDEMQSHYLKEFKIRVKEIFEECPDIGIVAMATYTPFFNDGEDCLFSSFMKRKGNPIGEDPMFHRKGNKTNLPKEIEVLYSTTPSCEGLYGTTAQWEAEELGLSQETINKLEQQHNKFEEFFTEAKESIKFFIPEDTIWFIANHNNEIHFDIREYKDHE